VPLGATHTGGGAESVRAKKRCREVLPAIADELERLQHAFRAFSLPPTVAPPTTMSLSLSLATTAAPSTQQKSGDCPPPVSVFDRTSTTPNDPNRDVAGNWAANTSGGLASYAYTEGVTLTPDTEGGAYASDDDERPPAVLSASEKARLLKLLHERCDRMRALADTPWEGRAGDESGDVDGAEAGMRADTPWEGGDAAGDGSEDVSGAGARMRDDASWEGFREGGDAGGDGSEDVVGVEAKMRADAPWDGSGEGDAAGDMAAQSVSAPGARSAATFAAVAPPAVDRSTADGVKRASLPEAPSTGATPPSAVRVMSVPPSAPPALVCASAAPSLALAADAAATPTPNAAPAAAATPAAASSGCAPSPATASSSASPAAVFPATASSGCASSPAASAVLAATQGKPDTHQERSRPAEERREREAWSRRTAEATPEATDAIIAAATAHAAPHWPSDTAGGNHSYVEQATAQQAPVRETSTFHRLLSGVTAVLRLGSLSATGHTDDGLGLTRGASTDSAATAANPTAAGTAAGAAKDAPTDAAATLAGPHAALFSLAGRGFSAPAPAPGSSLAGSGLAGSPRASPINCATLPDGRRALFMFCSPLVAPLDCNPGTLFINICIDRYIFMVCLG